MYQNQNNFCVRLGSFTMLQKKEELNYTPDVCFMTQWPCLISWWVSADVKDRENLFIEPLCRAGYSPSMCILFLYTATVGFSSHLSATSTHWISLMQRLCLHNSRLSSKFVLSVENNTCKHPYVCIRMSICMAFMLTQHEGQWKNKQTNLLAWS